MEFFKKLFTKNKIIEKEVIEPEQEQEIEEVSNDRICDACELGIQSEQKSVKVAGKRYHVKPCWRNIQKMAKQQAFR